MYDSWVVLQGPLFLITWNNFTPKMNKWLHSLCSVGWNYWSSPKIYLACDYLSKEEFKLMMLINMMLINIIDKGSMPDSSSTTSPMGASLSDLLFSFVLEKYIVCEVCGLRSPSFESSSVLHCVLQCVTGILNQYRTECPSFGVC